MGKKWKTFVRTIENLDFFGREIEIYYKGKSKRTSLIGFIFTFLYSSMYIAFFIYKLVGMIRKTEVTFYDTYSYTGEPPNIKLTPDKFYGGFALGNPLTLETFVDNTIYTVSVIFMDGQKINGQWNFIPTPLKLETCSLERFGENYRDIFKTKSMEKMHCVPFLNHTLRGHLTYDFYSYYLVRFTPCINSTLNNFHCKPLSTIRKYLTQTFVTFKMEDVDLTPQDYHNPVVLRGKEVSATVGKNLFQDVHSFFRVVNIETEEDFIGFEALSSVKKEKYIKYDQSAILSNLKSSNLRDDIWNDTLVDVTIALSEQELTEKRTYPKLIVVLGDVGGLMEVFYSLFKILALFLTETLYKASLVNHLFRFDLNTKSILVKSKIFKTEFSRTQSINIYNNNKLRRELNEKQNAFNSKDEISKETNNKFLNVENTINIKKTKRKKKKKHISFRQDKYAIKKEEIKVQNNEEEKVKDDFIKNKEKQLNKKETFNIDKTIYNETQGFYNGIIDKLVIDKCYSYFCFCKKKKPLSNILLNEGMKIIIENLDVQNLFKAVYKREEIKDPIEMSEECKSNLVYNIK